MKSNNNGAVQWVSGHTLVTHPNFSIIGSCVVVEGLGWVFVIHFQARV